MREIPKWDGHVHGPFCQHGCQEPQRAYVDMAMTQGFRGLTFTEHSPLPGKYLVNSEKQAILSMPEDKWPQYLAESWRTKKRYAGKIDVHVGVELDFLPEDEDFTLKLLDDSIEMIEEVVLSVHHLPCRRGIRCIDWSAHDLREGIIDYYGTFEKFVDAYYENIALAVEWAIQLPVPVRLGHLTLYRKFQREIPEAAEFDDRYYIENALKDCERFFVGIEVNASGRDLDTCQDWYLPKWAFAAAASRNIPLVYGSDAHHPKFVGRYYQELVSQEALR